MTSLLAQARLVPPGETRIVDMPDGGRVWLTTGCVSFTDPIETRRLIGRYAAGFHARFVEELRWLGPAHPFWTLEAVADEIGRRRSPDFAAGAPMAMTSALALLTPTS